MKKKIAIILIIAITLIVIGVVIVAIPKKEKSEVPKVQKEDIIYKEPETKQTKLNEITTKDKRIKIKETYAYNREGTSGINLSIISEEKYVELYLGVTLNMGNSNETRVIYLKNVEPKKEISYEIQGLNDWSKIDSWKVKKLTKDEAIALGFKMEG